MKEEGENWWGGRGERGVGRGRDGIIHVDKATLRTLLRLGIVHTMIIGNVT